MTQAASIKDLELGGLLPGIKVNTSTTDFAPISQLQLMKFKGEAGSCPAKSPAATSAASLDALVDLLHWKLMASAARCSIEERSQAPRCGHDGLEREFKFFNRLEGGVCATCAPGDQERSQHC